MFLDWYKIARDWVGMTALLARRADAQRPVRVVEGGDHLVGRHGGGEGVLRTRGNSPVLQFEDSEELILTEWVAFNCCGSGKSL